MATSTAGLLPYFTCCKCRTELFDAKVLKKHEQGKHSFSIRKAGKDTGSSSACTSYFLENSLPWMDANEVEGKLVCPKCNGRVGSYNWSGNQCSCGTWVTPAIQVLKTRVDVKIRGQSPKIKPTAAKETKTEDETDDTGDSKNKEAED